MAGRKKYVPSARDKANVEKWAAEGFDGINIAKKLKISYATWKRNSELFAPHFKKGKDQSDKYKVKLVEDALLKRATGFEHNGKYYAPSDTAAIFFLVNRARDRWRSINNDREDDQQPRAVDFKFTIVKSDEDKTGN